jgi:hypothetical protein
LYDRENRIPYDIPEVRIQKEQNKVHRHHQNESNDWHIGTERRSNDSVIAILNAHLVHYLKRILE